MKERDDWKTQSPKGRVYGRKEFNCMKHWKC